MGGGGELDNISAFIGKLVIKRAVTFLRGAGCRFYIENKLKYEIFNDKKSS